MNDVVRKGMEMRAAQRAFFQRSKKGDWKTTQEKENAVKQCKKLEREFDQLCAEAYSSSFIQTALPL